MVRTETIEVPTPTSVALPAALIDTPAPPKPEPITSECKDRSGAPTWCVDQLLRMLDEWVGPFYGDIVKRFAEIRALQPTPPTSKNSTESQDANP